MIEIHKTMKCEASSPKTSFLPGNIFLPASTSTATLPKAASSICIEKKSDDSGSGVPKTSHSFSSIGEFDFKRPAILQFNLDSLLESAFDSNQSVAGSSVEVLSECSSQASHVSQASQSSIEVLDRKPSEERRISQAPSLDTIEDDALKSEIHEETLVAVEDAMKKSAELKPKVLMSIGNINLTESSSSGSVCESVVTAYEQNGSKKDKVMETSLDGIFKSSSILLSKTPKPKRDVEPSTFQPIQYNFDDLTIVDHRVKLHLFQNVLEENDEKLIWLVKCLVIEDEANNASGLPGLSLVVMSTKKVYVCKVVADENEDISSWLKKSMTCSIDRIAAIRAIPSKVGFSLILKSSTNVHLLLQDQNVTDSLRTHIGTSSQCTEIS